MWLTVVVGWCAVNRWGGMVRAGRVSAARGRRSPAGSFLLRTVAVWAVGRWSVACTGDVGVYPQMMVDMGKQARLRYAGTRRCSVPS